jgi:hypothetical protein
MIADPNSGPVWILIRKCCGSRYATESISKTGSKGKEKEMDEKNFV